ncbi:hypothetical protein [Myroides odoratus]|uniref:Uncharacterized protein n=1 Tax=Myroides odoratus TaxID=256 RepID=A0A378RHJ6_MYROD|nr:hypothetical protein [Myroides odoratus]QQU02526.1 hypothetical protein I6I89_11840 [Myroides odoratus]STZ26516.1 Uncharacterised protein [Myroides odoratus]
MKKKVLSIAVLLLASAVHAQVGIGTITPNQSAELTIWSKAEDKGLLIPSVPLTSTTDQTTISNGNVESLLVYATKKQGDIEPGFYYWNTTKWGRIVPDSEIANLVIKNFTAIISNEEVKTDLEQLFQTTGGNVYYDGTTFEYMDTSGTKQEIDFSALIQEKQTVTTLVNNNDGTYTYTNEAGVAVVIDVPAHVINNFEEIVNNVEVQEVLNQYIANNGGNMFYDGTTFEYLDANGIKQEVDFSELIQANGTMNTIVKANETTTKLVKNSNTSYTYYNESEIDSAGNPIANTGVTMKFPKGISVVADEPGYNVRSQPTWIYSDMIYQDNPGNEFYNTNGEFKKVFSTKFDGKPIKNIFVSFALEGGISTVPEYVANNRVWAMMDVRIYINDVLVKEFINRRYYFGGAGSYAAGTNQDYHEYAWAITIPNYVTLRATANTLEIKVTPTRNNFYQNRSSGAPIDGHFNSDTDKVFDMKLTGFNLLLFKE